jgi:TonB family protein
MTLKRLIVLSLIGHLVTLLVMLVLGFVSFKRPSREILHLQNVRIVERVVPDPPPPAAPEPEPTPAPEPQVEVPPPPPPPVERRREPEPLPEAPKPVELPPPPPPRQERVITPEPSPDVAELQQRELAQVQERQRQREEEERRRREAEEQRQRLQAEERRRLEEERRRPEPQPQTTAQASKVQLEGPSLGNYDNQLVNYLSRNWLGQRQWATTDLSVRITMTISRDGSFSDIRIVTSSGNLDFDAAAKAAVEDSSPGPSLPSFIREATISKTVRLTAR